MIPKIVDEALKYPELKDKNNEKMCALIKNKIGDVVDKPTRKKSIGCGWVDTIKCTSCGSLEKYKANRIAKGYTQAYGIY